MYEYAESIAISNFSFLEGGSFPEEFVAQAAMLHYRSIAITDHNTLSGIVRAYNQAKNLKYKTHFGALLTIQTTANNEFELIAYPTNITGYNNLCRLLTKRNLKETKTLHLDELCELAKGFAITLMPCQSKILTPQTAHHTLQAYLILKDLLCDSLISIALFKTYSYTDDLVLKNSLFISKSLNIPLLATCNPHYHIPERKPLHDVLNCIRLQSTLTNSGTKITENSERHLKSIREIYRIFKPFPNSIKRTLELSDTLDGFSLEEIKYEYPEIQPHDTSPIDYLTKVVWQNMKVMYGSAIPEKIKKLILAELDIIKELRYEKYFLTCYDIVNFARSRDILCQGRGSAANSAVCYFLGITSVDPEKIDLLFARFVSKERNEPPDIDIDFEHERREEVIQYIYEKFGREHAAIAATVITYKHRSAIRDIGKVLNLSQGVIDKLAKSVHRWTACKLSSEDFKALGLSESEHTIQLLLKLVSDIIGFPRHLSQHVGGFIISAQPLCELVPIMPASMENRTIIEWDKEDLETLGFLKIDVLALGMLTCIQKAISLINNNFPEQNLTYNSIPSEDKQVYEMICQADTLGLFQIESRAQISMLGRLKPRCFYDLVIEVAIVRPGPIHGNMVHPFLKRRNSLEKVVFPDEQVKAILGKTLGVPIFQEQAMRLGILLAGFTPGEADSLRRAMAAWKRNSKTILKFKSRIIKGMLQNGYTKTFAETCVEQMKGFSEYGFPESHAASFALIVYKSAWLKRYYPAEFAASLINSQPMGFYALSQIIQDLQRHHISVKGVDINLSTWSCFVRYSNKHSQLVLGFRLVKHLKLLEVERLVTIRNTLGSSSTIQELWKRAQKLSINLHKSALISIAKADGFRSMNLTKREALWEIRGLPETSCPIDSYLSANTKIVDLKKRSTQQAMFDDYSSTGLSLRAHPIQLIRSQLSNLGASPIKKLKSISKRLPIKISVAGIAIFKQRPRTAKGVTFITLEDETDMANLIIKDNLFDRYKQIILSNACLLAIGLLERNDHVIYINVQHLESLDDLVYSTGEGVALPGRSWSY